MRRCVWSRNLKNEEAMTRVGSQRHQKKNEYMNVCLWIVSCILWSWPAFCVHACYRIQFFFPLFCVGIYGHNINVIRIIGIVRQFAMWRDYFDHENMSQIWKNVDWSVYGPLIVSDVAQWAINIARSKQRRCWIYRNITEKDSVACACVSRFCGFSMGMIWFVYVQSYIRLISLS